LKYFVVYLEQLIDGTNKMEWYIVAGRRREGGMKNGVEQEGNQLQECSELRLVPEVE
jgi:hypothetical protein